jgi:hypothetical protein
MVSCFLSDTSLLRLAYKGRSMRGTFKDGDCLCVAAVPFTCLQKGDVVAFNAGGKAIAHRIVGREASGFVTQGDASSRPDGGCLTSGRLIGLVLERERHGKRSLVPGGIQGRLRGWFLRAANRVLRLIVLLLATPYRLTCTSRLAHFLWRPRIMTVHFSEGEEECTKFIHRGKTVACWFPNERRWTCRKPYDLIIAPPVQ